MRIFDADSIIKAVNDFGIIPFYSSSIDGYSMFAHYDGDFFSLWDERILAVNSGEILYGKFINGKAAFVSKEIFPYLCNYRRDGYDFDSRVDEGTVAHDLIDIMKAVGDTVCLSYDVKQRLSLKGFDTKATKLQHQTYLCIAGFAQSQMGLAKLTAPETIHGNLPREKYNLSTEECYRVLLDCVMKTARCDEESARKILK